MRAVILSVAVLVAVGTRGLTAPGSPNAPADATVAGTVQFDGKPLATGVVTFHPADPKAKPVAATLTDGKYDVKAIPAGEYKVTVDATIERPDPKDPKKTVRVSIVPAKYSDPKATLLTAKVAPGANTLDLQLASR